MLSRRKLFGLIAAAPAAMVCAPAVKAAPVAKPLLLTGERGREVFIPSARVVRPDRAGEALIKQISADLRTFEKEMTVAHAHQVRRRRDILRGAKVSNAGRG